MKHSEYIEVVKGLGHTALKNALLKGIIKNIPFLAFGPWNILTVKVVEWLATQAVQEAEMRLFFQFIDFRTNVQAKDFESAMMYNHTMQKIGTEQEKKDAETKLIKALNNLVSLKA